MITNVGIVGLGALGVLYGTELQKALGYDNVLIIADAARIRRYREQGVCANGRPCRFRYLEAGQAQPVDLLIFAVKFQGLEQAIESARSACGPRTVVMSLLNGVSSEGIIAEKLRPQHLLYCTVQGMDATRRGNEVSYTMLGSVSAGEKNNSHSPELVAVQECFLKAGIPFTVPEDIMRQLWNKWMLNVGVNQACAVNGVGYGGVQREGAARTAMLAAMEEARQVAVAEKIALTKADIARWLAVLATLSPDCEPSMRQDAREGRPTEVALFSGVVCALGAKHGIPVPQNQEFYRILTAARTR